MIGLCSASISNFDIVLSTFMSLNVFVGAMQSNRRSASLLEAAQKVLIPSSRSLPFQARCSPIKLTDQAAGTLPLLLSSLPTREEPSPLRA
jgi:hypothetical protein